MHKFFAGLTSLALICYGIELSLAREQACSVWLCPDEFNPTHVYELQQDAIEGRSARTIAELQRALEFDPGSAYRRADLGESFATAHAMGRARKSFKLAVEAGPRNPAILVRAANFNFAAGEKQATMELFARVLAMQELRDYYTAAFLTYSRMDLPVQEILRSGIPPKPFAAQAFLRFLMEGNQVAQVEATWDWMRERKLGDERIEGDYLAFLVSNRRARQAAETWSAEKTDPAYRKTNWLFNGGFEATPKASPMDWHLDSSRDVQIERVRDSPHDGGWCVQITFAGQENVALHSVYQYAVLPPGRWRIGGFLKTASVTTDQGISLRLYDAEQSQRLDVRTDPLAGSHDWTAVERTFQVTPQTQLLRIEMVREPSEKFDNKIAGTVWLDSVELTPVR